MARIENQGVYPIKTNPVGTDYFPITDSEDSNKTKNVLISSIQATLGATIYTSSDVIPEARTVGFNNTLNFTGSQSTSEFLAQHTAGNILRVNQNGIFSTSLGVGVTVQQPSAILQADSTTQGILPPRLTTAQRDAIVSPAQGLAIYNTTTLSLETYNGTSWISGSTSNIYTTDGSIPNSVNRSVGIGTGAQITFVGTNLTGAIGENNFVFEASEWVLEVPEGVDGGHILSDPAGITSIIADNTLRLTLATSGVPTTPVVGQVLGVTAVNGNAATLGYVNSEATTIYTASGTITDQARTVTLDDTNDSGELLTLQATGTTTKAGVLALGFNTATLSVTDTATTGLTILTTSATFTDAINSRGIVYATDYSSNFTNRSLVDKGYVDGQISGVQNIYTANGTFNGVARVGTGETNSTLTLNMHDTNAATYTTRGRLALASTSSTLGFETGNGAGVVTAQMQISMNTSAMTITDSINSRGVQYAADYSANYVDRSLVDKAYVDTLAPGLEAINEGSGIGHRIAGVDPNNYGNIGLSAVDLSNSTFASTTNGATGSNSFATGENTISSGDYSFTSGSLNQATGNYSHAEGLSTIAGGLYSHAQNRGTSATGNYAHAEGDTTIAVGAVSHAEGGITRADGSYSHSGGFNTFARSYAETSIGVYPTDYTASNTTGFVATDRIFNIGNGQGAVTRSDALTILKNGTITAPSLTIALINTAGNPALITKEYADATYSGGSSIYSANGSIPAATDRTVTVPTDSKLEFVRGTTNVQIGDDGLNPIGFRALSAYASLDSQDTHSYLRVRDGNPLEIFARNGAVVQLGSGGILTPPAIGQVLASSDVLGTLEWVDNSSAASFTSYVALIDQTATGNPTATVMENTTGGTIAWTRDGVGDYTATLSGATFDLDKTLCLVTKGVESPGIIRCFRNSDTVLKLQNYDTSGSATDILTRASLEIRIYP